MIISRNLHHRRPERVFAESTLFSWASLGTIGKGLLPCLQKWRCLHRRFSSERASRRVIARLNGRTITVARTRASLAVDENSVGNADVFTGFSRICDSLATARYRTTAASCCCSWDVIRYCVLLVTCFYANGFAYCVIGYSGNSAANYYT